MRSRHLLILISAFGLCHSPFTAAQLAPPERPKADTQLPSFEPLTGRKLVEAFRGKTMDGIYKTPRESTGTNKFTETFKADGSTEYFEGPLVDTGQWTIGGRLICFRYDGALAGDISCFHVYKSGSCLYSYNPANIGPDGYPIRDNLWSVKTVTTGDITSCGDFIS